MRAFFANKLALIGAAITGFVLLAVIAGPWVSPYSPTDADFLALLTPPSAAHPFGTDSFGRDVLTRILYGARVSLAVSVAGVLDGCCCRAQRLGGFGSLNGSSISLPNFQGNCHDNHPLQPHCHARPRRLYRRHHARRLRSDLNHRRHWRIR